MNYRIKNPIILLCLFCIILIIFFIVFKDNTKENGEYVKIELDESNCYSEYKESSVVETSSSEEEIELNSSNVNDDDLYWLSRIVMQEMGGDWVSDELQQMVASVVMNRVDSEYFPDTIKDVIFQKGQYAGAEYLSGVEPTDKVIKNCKYILENGSILPSNVVFQAEFVQGDGVYYTYYDKYVGSTTYFCYKN